MTRVVCCEVWIAKGKHERELINDSQANLFIVASCALYHFLAELRNYQLIPKLHVLLISTRIERIYKLVQSNVIRYNVLEVFRRIKMKSDYSGVDTKYQNISIEDILAAKRPRVDRWSSRVLLLLLGSVPGWRKILCLYRKSLTAPLVSVVRDD